MIITRTSMGIEILAPAKVNLFLEVLGRRPDGFHEIETVLCPIDLHDRFYFEPTASDRIDFQVILPATSHENPGSHEGGLDPAWAVPSDESNLAFKAVQRVRDILQSRSNSRPAGQIPSPEDDRYRTGHDANTAAPIPLGCRMVLEKRIPAAAGLGGGSSNAAAAVVASLLAWSHWDRELAVEICGELGSDVPFFLGDKEGFGIAFATGRGELCQRVVSRPDLKLIVTHPPVGCSTASVYGRVNLSNAIHSARDILVACEDGEASKIGARLSNSLQSAAASLTDWIEIQMSVFARCGVQFALMSGSGSSCFAVLDEVGESSGIHDRILAEAKKVGLTRVFTASACYGASIESQIQSLAET